MTRHTTAAARRHRAFTLVELLVVIAIIGVLMGLILAGLRGAFGTARKTKEVNLLRGVVTAWTQYANNYEENLLPGYLNTATQSSWRVSYSNSAGTSLPASLSQTYPWRLARFMDDLTGTLLWTRTADDGLLADAATSEDWPAEPALPAWMSAAAGIPGSAVSLQPAFGYNGYYLGGWHDGTTGAEFPRFANARWTPVGGTERRGELVATRLANIQRPSQMIVFSTATFRGPGNFRYASGTDDALPGNAWVVPPRLGSQSVWGPYEGSQASLGGQGSEGGVASLSMFQTGYTETGVLGVGVAQGVPTLRYTRQGAVGRADGSTEAMNLPAMMDMQFWVNGADTVDFAHQND
jgi:prepilin-type N-terminal cleavage/methylation domain-containing protein